MYSFVLMLPSRHAAESQRIRNPLDIIEPHGTFASFSQARGLATIDVKGDAHSIWIEPASNPLASMRASRGTFSGSSVITSWRIRCMSGVDGDNYLLGSSSPASGPSSGLTPCLWQYGRVDHLDKPDVVSDCAHIIARKCHTGQLT